MRAQYCELTIEPLALDHSRSWNPFALNLSGRERQGKAAIMNGKSGYMRAQYCELAMEPMALMLALGSWPSPVPPGTCTGTETPGDIRPRK